MPGHEPDRAPVLPAVDAPTAFHWLTTPNGALTVGQWHSPARWHLPTGELLTPEDLARLGYRYRQPCPTPIDADDPVPAPCPWCAVTPAVLPRNPEIEGEWWALVRCENQNCPSGASIDTGLLRPAATIDANKAAAVRRWNTRLA